MEIFAGLGDREDIGQIMIRLAVEHARVGQFEQARAGLAAAAGVADEVGAEDQQLFIRHTLAEIARWQGRLDEAREMLEAAIADFERGSFHVWQRHAALVVSRARVELAAGDLERAKGWAERALEPAVTSRDRPVMARVVELRAELALAEGDAERAAELLGPGSADAVLCHGVLGVVSDQAAAVAALARLLRPGGTLSLVAANRVELVVRHARRGDYREALRLLDDPAVSPPRGRGSGQSARAWTLDEIRPWCTGAGLEIVAEHGLRVFTEPPPGTDQAELDAARELERRAATREPYRSGSEYLHVLAVRPGS
jgi:SAM-dependent methyltransferase